MADLKPTNKKTSFVFYLKQLLLFAVCAVFFGIGANAQSSVETPKNYKITLPQKIEGIQKLEYMIDEKNMGSTSGVANVQIASQSVINFLIQVEPENYSQLQVKDVKINTQNGQTLNLMKYMYDRNGEFTKVLVPGDELVDPKQTYVTSDYRVYDDDTLSLNKIKRDTFNAQISIDTNDYSISEALDISYKFGASSETMSPIYNEKENCLEINNVTANTPITLTFNKNQAFSQSEIEVFNGENKINLFEDGSTTIPAIKSDVYIVVKNVNKNRYNLSFKNHDGFSFEYRKNGEENFKSASNEVLDIIHGESYDLKCLHADGVSLENKEVTSNGVALKEIDNMYRLTNIQEDIRIEVSQKEASSYNINLPNEESGAIITNEFGDEISSATAKYGENFKFKLKANDGYTQNIENVRVYAVPTDKLNSNDYDVEKNPEESSQYLLAPSLDGVITISEVKESTSIVVKNLIKNTYRLNFPESPVGISYEVEASEDVKEVSPNVFTVSHGSKVFVTLTASEGKYLGDHALSSSSSQTLITNKENRYTIENVKEDTDIIIPIPEEKKCNVTFDSPGVICEDLEGNALVGNSLTVDYNGSAEFKISLAQGYKTQNGIGLSISSGTASLTKLDAENSFKISNVTDDVNFSVSGLENEKILVRFGSESGEKLVFKTIDGEELPSETQIEFGSDLEFEVSSFDGSEQTYNVTSNNRNAQLEALNTSANRFALRKATSNTTLSASPVYTFYGTTKNAAPQPQNDTEQSANNISQENSEDGLYNTSYVLEEPSVETNIDNTYSAVENREVTRSTRGEETLDPNNSISLLPESNPNMKFVRNGTEVSWQNMIENYDLEYTSDWDKDESARYPEDRPVWKNLTENPNLKLYDNESTSVSTYNNQNCYAYKMKLRIRPKDENKIISDIKLMAKYNYSNSGNFQTVNLFSSEDIPEDGLFRSDNISTFSPGRRPFPLYQNDANSYYCEPKRLEIYPNGGQYSEVIESNSSSRPDKFDCIVGSICLYITGSDQRKSSITNYSNQITTLFNQGATLTFEEYDTGNCTALIPEGERIPCYVNGEQKTWDYMLQNYNIYYKADFTDDNSEWLTLANNPNLKIYDDQIVNPSFYDSDGDNTQDKGEYHYRPKIKIIPKVFGTRITDIEMGHQVQTDPENPGSFENITYFSDWGGGIPASWNVRTINETNRGTRIFGENGINPTEFGVYSESTNPISNKNGKKTELKSDRGYEAQFDLLVKGDKLSSIEGQYSAITILADSGEHGVRLSITQYQEGIDDTVAMQPEGGSPHFTVSAYGATPRTISWETVMNDYNIYYSVGDANTHSEWHPLSENPNLKVKRDQLDDTYFNQVDTNCYLIYKINIKVEPKDPRKHLINDLDIHKDDGPGNTDRMHLFHNYNTSKREWAGHDGAQRLNVNWPYAIYRGFRAYESVGGDNKKEILRDSYGNHLGIVGHAEIRLWTWGSADTFAKAVGSQTVITDWLRFDIYEDEATDISPLDKVTFSADSELNLTDVSKVRLDYEDFMDSSNNCSVETSNPVTMPIQDLSVRKDGKPIQMRCKKRIDETYYKSAFEMKFTVESSNGVNSRIIAENMAMNFVGNKSSSPPFNNLLTKYTAFIDNDGDAVYYDKDGNMVKITENNGPNEYNQACKLFRIFGGTSYLYEYVGKDEYGKDKWNDAAPSSSDRTWYKLESDGETASITIRGQIIGTISPYSHNVLQEQEGGFNHYIDNIKIPYDHDAPKYCQANVEFTDSYSTKFVKTDDNSFPEKNPPEANKTEESIPASGYLDFKLKVDKGSTITFYDNDTDENKKELLKNSIKIEAEQGLSQFINCDYNLEVLSYDHTYVTYRISNIVNKTNKEPINLKIKVNAQYINIAEFEGVFTANHSKYEDENSMPISYKTIKYDQGLTFYAMPDSTSDKDNIAYVAFTVNDTQTYFVPLDDLFKPEGHDIPDQNSRLHALFEEENNKLKITLSEVKANFTVCVCYNLKLVDVNFHADNNFRYKCLAPISFAGENGKILPDDEHQDATEKIPYGSSLSFIIIPKKDGVNLDNIQVTAEGIPVDLVNGKYTISSITEKQNIRVSGISLLKNNVTFTQYDDVFFKTLNNEPCNEQTPVEYGGEISFKVTTSSAYSGSAEDIKIFAEYASGSKKQFQKDQADTIYNENEKSYTLKNVTEAVRIYVENMEPNKYTVTLNPMKGIDYYNEYGTHKFTQDELKQSVTHGENFSFKVVAQTGYDISNLKIYDKPKNSSNSTQLFSSHDVYTISNITQDHIVSAQNVPKSKCKVEFRTLAGANFTDPSGNTIDKSIEVDYDSDYTFKLSLESAYNKSQPSVNIKGTQKALQKAADGSYTISNIKEDKIIEVSNVSKNTYTATFVDTEGVIYRTAKNKPFTGTQPVEYEGTLYFKISLMDAYDKSTPLVLLDDKKVLGENSGVYSISNIHDDVVVTVKNVVKNPEEVSIAQNLTVPPEINTDSDVDSVIKATKTYLSLSDEEKEQVTNVDDLKKAQEEAGRVNHASGDVEIAGVDWNVKLVVTPLTNDEEQMKIFQEKVDRRSLFSLYEIHLVDLLTGKDYEVPYGQKVSVILPAPNLAGCANPVVAHETSGGSMEYLDLSIVDNRAQFETSSFSMFGIAAKKLENYVENPSNMKISVGSLVEDEDELRALLGEGLVSKLGNLLDEDDKEPEKKEIGSEPDGSVSNEDSLMDVLGLKKVFSEAGMEDSYNWILEHELIIVSSILLVGSLLIWWLLAMARKKKNEEEEKSKKK